jgi:hypothetical protein
MAQTHTMSLWDMIVRSMNRNSLSIGDRVSFHHNDGETEPRWYKFGVTFEGSRGSNIGRVVKLNRSRARVQTDDGLCGSFITATYMRCPANKTDCL